ncbi:hypothetical protein VPH35_082236 [Triticum aestivum]
MFIVVLLLYRTRTDPRLSTGCGTPSDPSWLLLYSVVWTTSGLSEELQLGDLGGDRKSCVLQCNALAICEDFFKEGVNKQSENSFAPSENYVPCLAPLGIDVKLYSRVI